MADDDLSAPLGQGAVKRSKLVLPVAVPQAVAGVLLLFVVICTVWAVVVDDPLGGEPVAVVATGRAPGKLAATMPVVTSGPLQGPSSYEGPPPSAAPSPPPQSQVPPAGPAPGTKTVTIIDGSTGKRQEMPIAGSRDARAPIDQRLLEPSRHGAIPRIAPDGLRPADFYANPVKTVPGRAEGPRVAIVLAGLGVSANVTQQAMTRLPKAVTFGFTPYGSDVDRAVTSARAEGRDVLLQVPMEPFDYPDNDPGPQTLLMGLSPEQNLDRLHWLMSRTQGYVGIMNYMGARFTSTEQALAPVLRETGKRGLIYVDDGSSPRSLAGQVAGANNLPFVKAEIVLDSVPTPAHIDRALTRLEAMAREHGTVVGVASALPASIDRIAQWAKAAESRGITLVPISAAIAKPKSS